MSQKLKTSFLKHTKWLSFFFYGKCLGGLEHIHPNFFVLSFCWKGMLTYEFCNRNKGSQNYRLPNSNCFKGIKIFIFIFHRSGPTSQLVGPCQILNRKTLLLVLQPAWFIQPLVWTRKPSSLHFVLLFIYLNMNIFLTAWGTKQDIL